MPEAARGGGFRAASNAGAERCSRSRFSWFFAGGIGPRAPVPLSEVSTDFLCKFAGWPAASDNRLGIRLHAGSMTRRIPHASFRFCGAAPEAFSPVPTASCLISRDRRARSRQGFGAARHRLCQFPDKWACRAIRMPFDAEMLEVGNRDRVGRPALEPFRQVHLVRIFRPRSSMLSRFFQNPWFTKPTVSERPTRNASRMTAAGSPSSCTVREQMTRSKCLSGKARMKSIMSP
ncbi:MAG: hypothetical protein MZV63_06210 [Marinilabiliales bacterium]|nr:hypothetical protein [Marinilabiliales bacterium]